MQHQQHQTRKHFQTTNFAEETWNVRANICPSDSSEFLEGRQPWVGEGGSTYVSNVFITCCLYYRASCCFVVKPSSAAKKTCEKSIFITIMWAAPPSFSMCENIHECQNKSSVNCQHELRNSFFFSLVCVLCLTKHDQQFVTIMKSFKNK